MNHMIILIAATVKIIIGLIMITTWIRCRPTSGENNNILLTLTDKATHLFDRFATNT